MERRLKASRNEISLLKYSHPFISSCKGTDMFMPSFGVMKRQCIKNDTL